MKRKIDYVQGFCKIIGCNGLYPIEVKKEKESNYYKKSRIYCKMIEDGKCSGNDCDVFEKSPDIVNKE